MKTKLKYLGNTYLFVDKAKIIDISSDEKGSYCLLDSTIFYPQGGGQASDVGFIEINHNKINIKIKINFVGFVGDEVRHYFSLDDFDNLEIKDFINKDLMLEVDKDIRMQNSKSHTAGHLVSLVCEDLGELLAVKGYHFLDGSYIEFEGQKPTDTEDFIAKVNLSLKEFVDTNTDVISKIVTKEELKKLCKNPPINLPTDKPIRIMKFYKYDAIACGGTHLNSLKDLNSVIITKIKSKKGRVKISYSFV